MEKNEKVTKAMSETSKRKKTPIAPFRSKTQPLEFPSATRKAF